MQRQKSILSFFKKPETSGGGKPIVLDGSDEEIKGTDTPPEKEPRRIFADGRPSLFSSIRHKFAKVDCSKNSSSDSRCFIGWNFYEFRHLMVFRFDFLWRLWWKIKCLAKLFAIIASSCVLQSSGLAYPVSRHVYFTHYCCSIVMLVLLMCHNTILSYRFVRTPGYVRISYLTIFSYYDENYIE